VSGSGCRKREQRFCGGGSLGCGGKGAENSSQRRRFLPPNRRYRDLGALIRSEVTLRYPHHAALNTRTSRAG
jgi:hypothetical protein